MNGLKKIFFLFGSIVVFIYSCKRDDTKAGWETNIVTPLLHSSLSILDIYNDTLIHTGSDNLLKVVYENHLYKMSLDSLFKLPDTSVTKNYKLDSISLLNQTISYPVTLGQIDPQLGILNGLTLPIPAIPNQSSQPFVINADTLFQTMTLINGIIDVSVHNGFPIDITNVAIDLVNTSNGVTIVHASFPLIASNTTVTNSYSLAGKTVEGNMTGTIDSISSPGSGVNPVLIDTSDALVATLSIHDLHPSSATAIFPAQDLINKSQPFKFKLDSVQLKEAKVQSGNVVMDLYSTLQDSVHFTYSLPSATLNGVPFIVSTILPPAPPNGVSHFYHQYDFSGYHLDMSGLNNDTVNTMYNSFIARIDSTGQMTTLSLTDSMYAYIGFVSLKPSYGKGYLGQQQFNIGPSELPISIFNNINGTLQLEDVKMSIVAENGIGVDGKVDLTNLTSVNSRTGHSVTLSGSAVSSPFIIQRATETGNPANPVNVVSSELLLNKTNSNAPAFISNLPDKITYSMGLETNPNGNNLQYNDFIYADHLMEFNINVEMPLSYIANNLNFTLIDTADFQLNQQDLARIKDGVLTLLVDNGFPFSVDITLEMLDLNGKIISTLLQHGFVEPANVGTDGKVSSKQRSKINIALSQDLIHQLFNTTKMKISAKYATTTPSNVYYKIYSDYTIDFHLTGDFTYQAH